MIARVYGFYIKSWRLKPSLKTHRKHGAHVRESPKGGKDEGFMPPRQVLKDDKPQVVEQVTGACPKCGSVLYCKT